MQAKLSLKYSGPAVDAGLMDVYAAAANMVAFSEFIVAAAKATYGENTTAQAEVAGFGRGSFVTDIVFQVAGPLATVFSAATPDSFLDVIKQAFDLWKHLKGSPPTSVTHNDDHQTIKVTNNSGQVIIVKTESLSLVFSDKASGSVEQFVGKAMGKDGMDSVQIETDKKPLAIAQQSEASYFGAVKPSETVTNSMMEIHLVIEAPHFKDGNKWRFYDGQNSFAAEMADKEFLDRVDNGERFGKGDILRVELQTIQQRSGGKISTERVVVKVIEHKTGPEQTDMFGRH